MGTCKDPKYKAVNHYPLEDVGDKLPGPSPGRRMAGLKTKARGWFTRKTLERRLPITVWIRQYSTDHLIGDLVAGLTVGLMIIPQALAYAAVAGLPANYGLNSAIFSSFLYVFFGSTTELNIGPTAIMSLMTYQYSSNGGADYAVLLCFLSGIIKIIAGFINLGFLINFISQPVISGFTSAAAITIASSQLKPLFGLKLKTKGLVNTWVKVIQNLADLRWQDLTLGVVCIVILSVMKPLRTIKFPCVDPKGTTVGQRSLRHVLFFLSVGRNAIVVILASVIAYGLHGDDQPFTLTGFVQDGIPRASLPPFSTEINNRTLTFGDMISDIGIGVVMVPFIGILDLIAVAGAFAKGKTFDANQEIIALGISSFVGSFFGSMPITACLSRTAVNSTSGARSPASGLLVGIIVLLALDFLTPAFFFIPKATLAAVIICAVLHMLDYEILLPLWRTKKIDLLPWGVTFFGCIGWGLEWGILLGIGVNLAMLLYYIAKPEVEVSFEETNNRSIRYVLVIPTRGLNYPNINHIRLAVQKAGLNQGKGVMPIAIDCTYIDTSDYTAAKGIQSMADDFQKRGQKLVLVGLPPSVVRTVRAVHQGLSLCPSYEVLEDFIDDKDGESPHDNNRQSLIAHEDDVNKDKS